MTVAHEIKYPWKDKPSKHWPDGYRHTFITIWHVDPCKDGSDDSCGWFQRARHGDKSVLDKISKRFEFDWDRTFTSDGSGKTYFCGYFCPNGEPFLSPTAIVLNLFFLAALEVFGSRDKAGKFMQKNLFEIMLFAENPSDSLHDGIIQKFGQDTKREERIRSIAGCIYGWILRSQRPWWKHPRWHFQHWKIQCHPLKLFKRWAFSRCCKCGGGFKYGESPVTHQWDSDGPMWFRSERHTMHQNCSESQVCDAEKQAVTE